MRAQALFTNDSKTIVDETTKSLVTELGRWE